MAFGRPRASLTRWAQFEVFGCYCVNFRRALTEPLSSSGLRSWEWDCALGEVGSIPEVTSEQASRVVFPVVRAAAKRPSPLFSPRHSSGNAEGGPFVEEVF